MHVLSSIIVKPQINKEKSEDIMQGKWVQTRGRWKSMFKLWKLDTFILKQFQIKSITSWPIKDSTLIFFPGDVVCEDGTYGLMESSFGFKGPRGIAQLRKQHKCCRWTCPLLTGFIGWKPTLPLCFTCKKEMCHINTWHVYYLPIPLPMSGPNKHFYKLL